MKTERLAYIILITAMISIIFFSVAGYLRQTAHRDSSPIQLQAAMPENGGWSIDHMTVEIGEPLQLHLTSQDVIHGFAVGQITMDDIELYPGQPVTTSITFNTPGTYTFYCTRWCGPNHWRMRGTIEVTGQPSPVFPESPRYVHLNMNIDAPHPALFVPHNPPNPQQGSHRASLLPDSIKLDDMYWALSPSEAWSALRQIESLTTLTDDEAWDMVAWIWSQKIDPDTFRQAKNIYQQECAACHGESGKGDGIMVRDFIPFSYNHTAFGHTLMQPPDFSDPTFILGAPAALIEGKILRGGMGTGMPLYGPIYTPTEIEALVNYLYSFAIPNLTQDLFTP
ncbi:MAG: c-type cytochrome [Anaerolineae bacterium]|nr:c-type cytochrome [Anaerolineae bacterium]